MPYPPLVPSGIRENTTPQVDLHPADHTEIHAALSDIINILGSNPQGEAIDLTAWLRILCPIGTIQMYSGASAPTNWGMCDGGPISRVDNPELFALFGSTYGPGDGSTTFNKPNMQARFPVGKGAPTWADTLGESGGSADSIVPSHKHAIGQLPFLPLLWPGGDPQGLPYTRAQGAGDMWLQNVAPAAGVNVFTNQNGSVTVPQHDTTLTGVPVADTNLPPFVVVNFIIRLG